MLSLSAGWCQQSRLAQTAVVVVVVVGPTGSPHTKMQILEVFKLCISLVSLKPVGSDCNGCGCWFHRRSAHRDTDFGNFQIVSGLLVVL